MRPASAIPIITGLWLAGLAMPAGQVVFRTQVELVRVDVSVTRDGRPLSGLGPQDFELRDDGRTQAVREVLVEKVPIDVTLLLDTSTSVEGQRLERLQEAANRLLAGLRPGDRAALLTFGHRISRTSALTPDLPRIMRLIGDLDGNGWTALHDAIFAALLQPQAESRRSAVVVFSDGLDTISWLSPAQVLDAAKRGESILYTVAEIADPIPGPQSQATSARAFLRTLAEDSGGRAWTVPDPGQFGEAFEKILKDVTTRYVLLYQPEGVSGDGWHPLSVKLTRVRGDVAARAGYYRR